MQLLTNLSKISSRRARMLAAATGAVVGVTNLLAPSGASAATFTWANNGITWSAGANWVGGTAPSNSTTVDLAIFQNAPVAQPFFSATRSIGAIDIQNSGYIFNGAAGTHINFGAGSATSGGLSGINTTNGATGNVTFNVGTNLSNTPVTFASTLDITLNGLLESDGTGTGRVLNIGSGTMTTGLVTIAGGLNMSSSGTIITAGRTLTINGSGTGNRNVLINSVITQGAGQTATLKIDSDTTATTLVQLTQANTYNGGTNMAGGVLQINQDANLGTGTVVVSGSSTLQVAPGVGTLALSAAHTLTVSGATSRTLTLDPGEATNALVVNNPIGNIGGGVASLTKIGAGTLVLNAATAINGTLTFSAGTLIAGDVNALGTGTLRFGGGTLSASQPTVLANTVNMSNASTIAGDQPITFNGPMLYSGTSDRSEAFRSTAVTTIAGGMVISSTSGARQFTISGTGDVNVNSVISETAGNPGTLRIINSGTVTLAQANTFTGGFILGEDLADVNIGNNQSLGTGTFHWLEGAIRSTGGTRTIANPTSLEPGTTGSLRLAGNGGDWFFTGPMTVTGGGLRQLAVGSTATATISGVINDSGDGTGFAKAGAGTLLLTHSNLYTGGTALRNGTTIIGNDDRFGLAASTLEFDGGVLRPNAAITSNRPMFINVGGGTYNTNGFNSTNNGAMSGTGVFNKDGAGQLSVKHLRTGGIGANDGTLKVISNGTAANVSQVGTITVGASGIIDITNNDMIVSGMSKAAVQSLLATGYNFGGYDGLGGVTTSTGANTGNTTLGMLDANEYANNVGDPNFDGVLVQPNDILVKYTYFGDVDFNGAIDASDYNLIDFGFSSHLSGWANGDADYSGSVDASDYNVIDFAFASQNGVVLRAIQYLDGSDRSQNGMADPSLQKVVEHFEQFGDSYANGFLANVPEPTTIGVIGLATGALMTRRRRRVAK